MKRTLHWILAWMLALAATAGAQRRNDPLTYEEINQLRDTAVFPEQRLKLYVEFARARLAAMDTMRSDRKTTDRAKQTHDLLDEFVVVYDELNDNIDTFVGRKNDIRKPLKAIIEADHEFQAKLRALKQAADATPAEAQQYEFVLTDATQLVDTSVDDHRKLLAKLEEAERNKKKKPH